MSHEIRHSTDEPRASSSYLAVILISAGWILSGCWQSGEIGACLVLGGSVALMLVLRIWLVTPLLFLTLLYLLRLPRAVGGAWQLGSDEVLFCAAAVALVIASCRYMAFHNPILPYGMRLPFLDGLEIVQKWRARRPAREPDRLGIRDERTIHSSEFLTLAIRVVIPILTAFFLLWIVPPRRDSIMEYGLISTGLRTISIGGLLFAALVVLRVLLVPFEQRGESRNQAGVYLRSVVTHWWYNDLARITKRQVRHRRKQKKS